VTIEALLRDEAPSVLGALVRRYGDFGACEDAIQEALIAAAQQWRDEVPVNPRGWLTTVASRRRVEAFRSDSARREREERATALETHGEVSDDDDSLTVLLLCCHPKLTPPSQVALTLRAVGGLTTAEIARAFLVPEATIAQRISRAKKALRGAEFTLPGVPAALQVLYLIFNEGYVASEGASLHRAELTGEAIRLTRQLRARRPGDGEVAGLLALMLLTEARRPARTRADGALVPLAEQDRVRWDRALIEEGAALIERTLATAVIGPFQVQAAIAALHDEAARFEDTDWRQILALYEWLEHLAPGPMVTLNRLVALAMVEGPQAALPRLDALDDHYRVDAVRAHLLDLAGDHEAAKMHYRRAAERTLSLPERRYLELKGLAGS